MDFGGICPCGRKIIAFFKKMNINGTADGRAGTNLLILPSAGRLGESPKNGEIKLTKRSNNYKIIIMKIVHVSDLHIGARLGRHCQNADIRACLAYIGGFCATEKIDLLIAAGDIFDTYNPSAESEDIYYGFLDSLGAGGTAAVIIGGNHDSHERLSAPAGFLMRHGVRVAVNRPDNDYSPFEIVSGGGESISVAAIPYVHDAQITDAAAQAEAEEAASAEAYSGAFNDVVRRCRQKCVSDIKILVAHAFFRGGAGCGSERLVQRGNSLLIDAGRTAEGFSYCAFGHLHRFQRVADNAYYSGSIIPVSIDEAARPKKMVLIDTGSAKGAGGECAVEAIDLPSFSAYADLRGGFAGVLSGMSGLKNAYISVVFNEPLTLERQDIFLRTARENDIRIVSQTFDMPGAKGAAGGEGISAETLSRLSMAGLFEKYLREIGKYEKRLVEKFEALTGYGGGPENAYGDNGDGESQDETGGDGA